MRLPPLLEKFLNLSRGNYESALQGLRDDIHELTRTIRDQQSTTRQQQEYINQLQNNIPERIIRAEQQIHEYQQREKRTYGKLQLWIQALLVMGTWLAFIAAFIYAGIAMLQLIEARNATIAAGNAAKATQDSALTAAKSLEADNRPWIKPVYSYDCEPVVANKVFKEPFDLKNVGKGIAGNISGMIVAQFLRLNELPDFNYSPGHPRNYLVANMLYPGDPTQNGAPITPLNKDGTVHISTDTEAREFDGGEKWIALHGRIEYTDLNSGKRHWVTFCTPRMNGSVSKERVKHAITTCLEWNRIDHD